MTSKLTDDPLIDKPDSLDQLKFDTPADVGGVISGASGRILTPER